MMRVMVTDVRPVHLEPPGKDEGPLEDETLQDNEAEPVEETVGLDEQYVLERSLIASGARPCQPEDLSHHARA